MSRPLTRILSLVILLSSCAAPPIPRITSPITRLIYVADSRPETVAQVKAAGFDGYIAFDVQQVVTFADSRLYVYFGEPEDRPDAYRSWRLAHATELRYVDYGNVDLAKELGVFDLDHAVIAHHEYPYKKGNALEQWWQEYLYPFRLREWKDAVSGSQASVVGTLQAFGGYDWVFPGCAKIEEQEAWWASVMGKQLAAIAYFYWTSSEIFDGLRDHPECWPANRRQP